MEQGKQKAVFRLSEEDLGLKSFVDLLFEKHDWDGNGSLEMDEFRVFLKEFLKTTDREAASSLTEDDVIKEFKRYDDDGS